METYPDFRTALKLGSLCYKGSQLEANSDALYFVARYRGNPQAWRNYYEARDLYKSHVQNCPFCQ